jgi:hypothetical protein
MPEGLLHVNFSSSPPLRPLGRHIVLNSLALFSQAYTEVEVNRHLSISPQFKLVNGHVSFTMVEATLSGQYSLVYFNKF